MFKKAHSILALAASATIGAGLLLAADNPADAPDQNNNAAVQDHAGMHGDHQIMEQVHNIAKDPDTASDKLFLLNTDIANAGEIDLNQAVAAKDNDPSIQQLSSHMIKDHTAMTPKLDQLAENLNIQLPHEVPGMQREEANIITSMSSKQMERAYFVHMYVAHQKLIACFESESTTSTNPKLRLFAMETVPTLQQHLAMVEQAAGAAGVILTPNEATPASAQIRGGTERPGALPGSNGVSPTK